MKALEAVSMLPTRASGCAIVWGQLCGPPELEGLAFR